jgi:choline dehydrogenase-like flavoprotein
VSNQPAAERHADTIVVGGGTAGAVLAGLLAAQTDQTVLLLEAGPDYGPFSGGAWPADLTDGSSLCNSHQWGYDSGNQYQARTIPYSRARVIGGCSAHNGCAAIWGHRADYDAWAALGNPAWSTEDLLPHFTSVSERLSVRISGLDEVQPFQRIFLDAAPLAGIPVVDNLNDLDEPAGVAPSPANIRDGVRWNAAFGYLDPVRSRPNLRILGDTLVDRIELDGTRATGVQAIHNGSEEYYGVDRVVLAAGAYGSPSILLRSGIGEPASLRAAGIAAIHDLPGVGRNLHDHPAIDILYSGSHLLKDAMTEFGKTRWLPEEQVIAKARSHNCREAFDLHIYPAGGPYAASPDPWRFTINVACMTPKSRGSLSLSSPDPHSPPLMDHGYLTDPGAEDIEVLLDGLDIAREIVSLGENPRLLGRELEPGPVTVSREQCRLWISNNVAHYYHPVGTCRMGPERESDAVVDQQGKVHGLEGLYVADCSIMPVIPRANTNIPAAVVGSKIAGDLIERW